MRKLIRSFLQRFGYDIVKYKQPFERGRLNGEEMRAEFRWLMDYRFNTIIDIGANEGQFSDKMRLLFPQANLYAFEPLPGVFEKLMTNFKNDSKFKGFNCGLGEIEGEFSFRENEYSPSSSFLDVTKSLVDNFEEAANTKEVLVQIRKLDNVFENELLDGPILVKIDVQGFEDKVLHGGKDIVQKATMVLCELSFVELYKKQLLFEDIYEILRSFGFRYIGNIENLRSPLDNRILQADGVFIK